MNELIARVVALSTPELEALGETLHALARHHELTPEERKRVLSLLWQIVKASMLERIAAAEAVGAFLRGLR